MGVDNSLLSCSFCWHLHLLDIWVPFSTAGTIHGPEFQPLIRRISQHFQWTGILKVEYRDSSYFIMKITVTGGLFKAPQTGFAKNKTTRKLKRGHPITCLSR